MKKISHFVLTVFSTCIALAAVSPTLHADTAVPLATWGGPNHINIRHFVPELEKALKERSSGSVTLEHYPGGQIAEDGDMPTAIPTGQVKTGWITVNGWSGTVSDTKVFDAPTGLTMSQMDEIIDQPQGLMYELNEKFKEKNSVLLALADLGPPAIVSNEPLERPEDFEGKKVRVFSQGQAEALEALGASPVSIPFADVYSALQYGTVDAAITGFQGISSQRLYEVTDYALVPASFFGTTMMGWAANKSWLNGLSENDKETVVNAFDVASHSNRKAILDEINELNKSYKEKGMKITRLGPESPQYEAWQTVMEPLLDEALDGVNQDIRDLIQNK